jgi:hypothetical protein
MAKRTTAPKTKPPFRCHDGREIKTLEHVIELLLELEIAHMALDQTVTDALTAQDAKIADLAAKVDAFIASHQGSSAADNAAIVAAVQAQGTAVDAISSKLA